MSRTTNGVVSGDSRPIEPGTVVRGSGFCARPGRAAATRDRLWAWHRQRPVVLQELFSSPATYVVRGVSLRRQGEYGKADGGHSQLGGPDGATHRGRSIRRRVPARADRREGIRWIVASTTRSSTVTIRPVEQLVRQSAAQLGSRNGPMLNVPYSGGRRLAHTGSSFVSCRSIKAGSPRHQPELRQASGERLHRVIVPTWASSMATTMKTTWKGNTGPAAMIKASLVVAIRTCRSKRSSLRRRCDQARRGDDAPAHRGVLLRRRC